MRPGWSQCGGSAQQDLVGTNIEAISNEAWLATVWRLRPMRHGWRGCGGSAWWGLVGVSLKALPDEAWLALVWRLSLTKPGWQRCGDPAQWGLVALVWRLSMRPGWRWCGSLLDETWCGNSAWWGLVNIGVEVLPNEAWLMSVCRLCPRLFPIRPVKH